VGTVREGWYGWGVGRRREGPIEALRLHGSAGPWRVYPVHVFRIGDTLIDSGCAGCSGRVVAWARERGIGRVVHTHHHEDHVGASARLASELGAEILAPAAAVALLARPYRRPAYRRIVWGQPRPVAARPLPDRVTIAGVPFDVVRTPGHTPDHVCLFQPDERWLFTGDLYVAAQPPYLRAVEDAAVILASLERVAALRPRLLCCAHSGFVENGGEALRATIRKLRRLGEAAEALARRGLTVRAVTRRLLGPEGWLTWISGGAFAKRHLVASLLRMRGVYP